MADKEHDASWAIKLLTPDQNEKRSILGQYGATICGVAMGYTIAVFINHYSRRPMLSGIHKHFGYSILIGGIARSLEIAVAKSNATNDAVLRHYISLHPEDFPEPEHKTFAEVLLPWTPIR